MREVLARIAAGAREPALLGACRLEWRGGEAYGEEAIRETFQGAPLNIDRGVLIETPGAAAWIDADAALIADLYDGRIGRLWRIDAETNSPATEPAVSVPFDPDLRQDRGSVYFRAEDHPWLDMGSAPGVVAAGESMIEGGDLVPHRTRAFVLRAFSSDAGTVALYMIHRLTGGAVRTAGFSHAMALIDGRDEPLCVIDIAASPTWNPRL